MSAATRRTVAKIDSGLVPPSDRPVRVGVGGDPFLVWPLLSSGGAWLFGTDADGAWDRQQVGIDRPESISAFERLGALAYGDLARAREAGLNVAVSPVPPFRDSEPTKPFVTVYGFYVAPFGRNRVIASDLLTDYLTRFEVMSALSARVGAPVARTGATALTGSATSALMAACHEGLAMPSFAGMPAVWRHPGRAEAAVIAGEDAATAARRAADAIRRIVA